MTSKCRSTIPWKNAPADMIVRQNIDKLITYIGAIDVAKFQVDDVDLNVVNAKSLAALLKGKGPLTVKEAFTMYADLSGPVSRYGLQSMYVSDGTLWLKFLTFYLQLCNASCRARVRCHQERVCRSQRTLLRQHSLSIIRDKEPQLCPSLRELLTNWKRASTATIADGYDIIIRSPAARWFIRSQSASALVFYITLAISMILGMIGMG